MDPTHLASSANPARPVNPENPVKSTRWNWLAVILLTLAAAAWTVVLYRGTLAYQPAYREPAETGAPAPALVPRLVLVVIDGLRYDLSEKMPCLQQLRSVGASARSIAVFPSYSHDAWTALLTGARPEIGGAPLFNAEYDAIQPIRVATLFEMAKRVGLTTALAGEASWAKMIPAQYLDRSRVVTGYEAEADLEAARGALELYEDPQVDLLLFYQGEYDEVAHQVGAFGPEALQSIDRTDQNLCELVSQVDLATTVLVVTADHGHLDAGGHGGTDRVVLETPLVMAGPRIRPGSYPPVQQPDIPMTISALLGLSFPRSGQGRVLYELLDVSEAEQAQGETALVAQQMAQAGAYLASIQAHPLPAELSSRLSGLDALLQAGDWAGAHGAAVSLQQQVGQLVDRERAAQLNRSRWLKLPVALLGLCLLALLFVANSRAVGRAPLLCSLVGVAACHGFYLLRGQVYSLSTLSSAGAPARIVLTLVLGAVLTYGLALGLLWLVSRRPAPAGNRSLALSIPALCACVVGLFFAQALGAWVANGSLGSWIFTVPWASFLLLLSVIQMAAAGLLAILMMSAVGIASLVRRR
jgi:hypothetical protein